MDEKKLMKLSKLILRRKNLSKKVPKMRTLLRRGVACFSSVYDILVCAIKVFNVFLL